MDNIPISYLLDMSDIEATNWLIENCHDYVLVKRTAIKQLRAENEALKMFCGELKNIAETAFKYQKGSPERIEAWSRLQAVSIGLPVVNLEFTTSQESQAAKGGE